jgi:hypothetical protein
MWGCGLSLIPCSGRVPSKSFARPTSPRTRPVHLNLHCSGARLQATRPGNSQPRQPQPRYTPSRETPSRPSTAQNYRQQQESQDQWAGSQPDDAEIKALQSAVDKSYKQKLLELRKVLTPETIADLRANTPPEQRAELDSILFDIQQLDGIDEADIEASVRLTEEEQQYVQAAQQDSVLPNTFEDYLQGMFPSYTPQELVQYLDQNLLSELEVLFDEMKEFERMPEGDVVEKYQQLSRKLDQLAMQQTRPNMMASSQQQQPQQEQQQQQQRVPRQRAPTPARRRVRGPLFQRKSSSNGKTS